MLAIAVAREVPVLVNDPSSFLQRLRGVGMALLTRLWNFVRSFSAFSNFSIFSKESWKDMAIMLLICFTLVYYSSNIVGAALSWCMEHLILIATTGAVFVQFCNGSYISIAYLLLYCGYLGVVYYLKWLLL